MNEYSFSNPGGCTPNTTSNAQGSGEGLSMFALVLIIFIIMVAFGLYTLRSQ